jgi:bifunctional non-homologous end joining protein LigD
MVFDLDPGEGVGFADVRRAAEDMRGTLQELGLESFPMLTGGKGVHVIVPMTRRYAFPIVKAFARAVVERLAETAPDRYVTRMSKAERSGRIYLDYLRNDRTSTAIAPFSPRARHGAPVAWPIEWSDLGEYETGAAVTVKDVLAGRREPADWKGYDGRRQITANALKTVGVRES